MDLSNSLRLALGHRTGFAEFLWASFKYDFVIFSGHNSEATI